MKRNYLSKANKIEAIHVIVFVITLFSMFFLFSSNILRIYSAIWLVGLWSVDHIYGSCPLTRWEHKLRTLAGQRIKKTKFIPRFLHKAFNLRFSDRLTELGLTVYFFFSSLILIRYFI